MKKPDWLKIPYYYNESSNKMKDLLVELGLNTVCVEANCPNCSECFSNSTATFMIMGTNCTRSCSFCNVRSGEPNAIDINEPERVAKAVRRLSLRYVVITSVTRDDLPDGGAEHFADVIREVKAASPQTRIEVLIPDLQDITVIADESPAVISHNIETVKSLYNDVRPQASYEHSLNVIKSIKHINPLIRAKSGLMLGMGETFDEVLEVFDDLLEAGCDILTIGQYLAPSKQHYPVIEYIHPHKFDKYHEIAKQKGFAFVAAAPLVRSSYNAEKALI